MREVAGIHRFQRHVGALLGHDLPIAEEDGGLRALDHGKPGAVAPARAYVEKAFGKHLPEMREPMEHSASRQDPEELNRVGFRLYERFRPEVAPGAKGWGAKIRGIRGTSQPGRSDTARVIRPLAISSTTRCTAPELSARIARSTIARAFGRLARLPA